MDWSDNPTKLKLRDNVDDPESLEISSRADVRSSRFTMPESWFIDEDGINVAYEIIPARRVQIVGGTRVTCWPSR
jgi:hypothetical protein